MCVCVFSRSTATVLKAAYESGVIRRRIKAAYEGGTLKQHALGSILKQHAFGGILKQHALGSILKLHTSAAYYVGGILRWHSKMSGMIMTRL